MILVTGGAGYIGSHCVLELLKQGFNVVVFDNLSVGHIEIINTLQKQNLKGKFVDYINGDLKNIFDVKEIFKRHKINAVIHFAAYSQVNESVKEPSKYYQNNVGGSINLLHEMINNNVKKIVFSSTASTYGEPQYTPIDEKHPQEPINPYGKTKLLIEKIMDNLDVSNNLKSVRLRYFNVIGADKDCLVGEWHEPETHLVPNILKSTFNKAQTFKIFGDDYDTKDGTCIRDYININDLIDAHILALNYLLQGGETNFFNLGTNEGNSVKEIFDICEEVAQQKIPVEIVARREGDPAILIAKNNKAKQILGWNPKRTLKDSIETAYKWEEKLNKIKLGV